MKEPVPVMPAELKSVPCTTALLRLMIKVPLLMMALVVASDPVDPPLPSWSVPALIVVVPV